MKEHKKVLITGATGGFGKSLAEAFILAGYDLIIHGRNEKKVDILKEELVVNLKGSQKIDTVIIDFSENNFKEQIRSFCEKHFDIDVLINNSAVHGPIGKFDLLDFELWENAFQVDFIAPVFLTKECIGNMKKIGRGHIINISGGGATGSRPNFTAYACSKTAMLRFTEIVAEELQETNIHINAIAPGPMATALLKEVSEIGNTAAGCKEVETANRFLRDGDNRDKAVDLCLFLATEESNHLNGKLISAQWDDWKNIKKEEIDNNKDLFTLRRIVK